MIIGYLSKREAEEKRHRWSEEALGLLAQQRPVDAARLAREWNEIILAELEAEESHQRHQQAWVVVLKMAFAGLIYAAIFSPFLGISSVEFFGLFAIACGLFHVGLVQPWWEAVKTRFRKSKLGVKWYTTKIARSESDDRWMAYMVFFIFAAIWLIGTWLRG